MQSPPITVAELLEENRRLRERHATEIAGQAQCLRDEFASKALSGLLAAEANPAASGFPNGRPDAADVFARHAYELADAMLRARPQTPEGRV